MTSRKKFLTGDQPDIRKEYAALEYKKIGLSINVTPAGGTFSWHHDRHEITAILCLNEVGGRELEFFRTTGFC